MVTLVVPGALRAEVGGATSVEVGAAGTVRAVLDAVAARWPRLERRVRDEAGQIRRYINVYVDGQDVRRLAGQETPVGERAEVRIIPSVAGGAGAEAADRRSYGGHPGMRPQAADLRDPRLGGSH